MSSSVRSLWSPEIRADILSPRAILKSQADALTQLTKGVLVGTLTERDSGENRRLLALDITVPTLDNYHHRVLVALHEKGMAYPVTLDAEVFRPASLTDLAAQMTVPPLSFGEEGKPANRADCDTELTTLVEKVLTSPQVVSLAQSLIARARGLMAEPERESPGSSCGETGGNGKPTGQEVGLSPPQPSDALAGGNLVRPPEGCA